MMTPNERVTDPERFGSVVDAARDLIGQLTSTYDVEISHSTGGFSVEGHDLGEPGDETVHLIPGDGIPLTLVVTNFPVVIVRMGDWEWQGFPACACDACDEQSESVIERMTELVDAVVGGRFEAELSRRMLRTSFRGPWGRSASEKKLERGQWKQYGQIGVRHWPEWSRRS